MHTRTIKRYVALLVTVSGMAALTMNATALSKLVTGSLAESGQSYLAANTGTVPALEVKGTAAFYNGVNINLTSTTNSAGYSSFAGYAREGGMMWLSGGTVNSIFGTGLGVTTHSSGSFYNVTIIGGGQAVRVLGTSSVLLEECSITSDNGSGVYLEYSSTGILRNVDIRSGGYGIYGRYENTTVSAENVSVVTTGNGVSGIYLTPSSNASLLNVSIRTEGDNGMGVHARHTSTITMTDGVIATVGANSHGVYTSANGAVVLDRVTVSVAGDGAHGVFANNGRVSGSNVILTASGSGANAIQTGSGERDSGVNSAVSFYHGALTVTGDLIVNGTAHNTVVLLDHVQVFHGGNVATNAGIGTLSMTMVGMELSGGITGSGSSSTTVSLDDSRLFGDITANDDAALTVNLDNASELTGKIDPVDLSV
ncbi:MAG: right-handed parallel beta-helix repeat-containing protein, partial [Verrucomicrobiales bacterium]|nr:right-handed parallel beta-helix repeat-containing protein [Verrucomicrobiales bacterium]